MIIYHIPLYKFAINNLNTASLNTVLIFITLLVVVLMFTIVILFFIAIFSNFLLKTLTIVIVLSNSIALYFITTYNVILDQSMMGNIVNTDVSEATSYLHPTLYLYVFIFGLIPAWIIFKITIKSSKKMHLISSIFITFVVCAGWIFLNANTWLWFDKHAKTLGGEIMPWSYVINTVRHQAKQSRSSKTQILLPDATFKANDKTVVFLVIGESARADDFSLYGYPRLTNPLLTKSNVTVLLNTTSCGTYTTKSVECMLSYTDKNPSQYEPLPSYLQRNGIEVIWHANNWGEPSQIKDKVKIYNSKHDLQKVCKGVGCGYDEILLAGLREQIKSSKSNKIFVVLHQKGSHGPDYYNRYPKRFEVFKSICKSVELNECSKKELINAYDNSILYTDYFLSEAIDILKELKNTKTMLMYISDHGESLGEYGLYLHGAPFSVAPNVQKKIPFIIWKNAKFDKQIKQKDKYGQYNVFHSIMSAFDMRSDIYNKNLDLFYHE